MFVRSVSRGQAASKLRSAARVLPIALAALLMLLLTRGAWAQQDAPVTVLAGLDRTHATVGDPVGLTVTIRYAAAVQVSAGSLDAQFAPFEVLSADPPLEQRASDGSVEQRLRFKIAAYRAGPLQLPALNVPYTLNGQTGLAQSQPLSFTVDSVITPGDAASDIRPLKPQFELTLPSSPPWRRIIGGGAGALVLLAVALAAWLSLRRRPVVPVLLAPGLPPMEAEARAELDGIVEEGLLARGEYRTHYARMAECIRRYISQRYGFPASAMTTAELSERMVRSGVGRWRARLVAGLLTECDAVHYAHYLPAPARADADLQMAYEIVDMALSQETRPEETRMEVGI